VVVVAWCLSDHWEQKPVEFSAGELMYSTVMIECLGPVYVAYYLNIFIPVSKPNTSHMPTALNYVQ
jgi:hypothetical protein